MKSLLLLVALSVAGYFAWQNDWPSRSLREGGARLERRLNHELISAGVTDRQITTQLRRERRRWFVVRWIENDREIVVANLPKAEEIAENLTLTAEKEGFSAEKDKVRGAILLDITRFGLRFQRVVLYPHAAR